MDQRGKNRDSSEVQRYRASVGAQGLTIINVGTIYDMIHDSILVKFALADAHLKLEEFVRPN
jgi:hypothetical protein